MADEQPDVADLLRPGAFGENFVVDGVTERDLSLGDRFQIGSAVVELSQSRQPCWKLNLRFNQSDMARRVQSTGRTGWYFRVLEPGRIAAGAQALLVARPISDCPLTRVCRLQNPARSPFNFSNRLLGGMRNMSSVGAALIWSSNRRALSCNSRGSFRA
jgi:MOSC domain-containing protein YiiM